MAKATRNRRTYTVEHTTGARLTFASLEDAASMTGWEGWDATDLDSEPVGLHLDAVPSKGALLEFAAAMMVDTSTVTTRTTRAELERLIIDRPDVGEED